MKQKDEEFHQTSLNYSTVISWYEDFLNTVIDLDKENSKIASITFKDFKNLDGSPHVKVEIMDGSKFKGKTKIYYRILRSSNKTLFSIFNIKFK